MEHFSPYNSIKSRTSAIVLYLQCVGPLDSRNTGTIIFIPSVHCFRKRNRLILWHAIAQCNIHCLSLICSIFMNTILPVMWLFTTVSYRTISIQESFFVYYTFNNNRLALLKEPGMKYTMIIPEILCFVFIVLSIPLILQKVRPNCYYGVRTRKTMTNDAVWYKANKFFGTGLLISSIFSLAILLTAAFFPGLNLLIGLNNLGGLIVVLPIGVLLVFSYFYFRKL